MFLTVGVIGGADIIIPMNMRLLGQAVLQALGLVSATISTSHFYSCIGLPIMFSDILIQVYGEYSKVDERPFPQKEDIAVGYIHRGLLVNTMEKE